MINKGDAIEVIKYRNNETPTIKIGVVEEVRNIHTEELKLKTYKRYVITRSQYLITLKDSVGETYRSYYDKFLTYRPITGLRRFWLKLRGKT